MIEIPISPLELDPLTRSYWGQWDAYTIGQLAPLAKNQCYKPKFYKAPASGDELIGAYQYATYGLRIPPGDIIFGFYCPALVSSAAAPAYNLQITDSALDHKFWDEPIPDVYKRQVYADLQLVDQAGTGYVYWTMYLEGFKRRRVTA